MKPYPEQLAAVEAAIRHGRGCVVMPTGTGKSLVFALLIAKLQVKTLIIVPTLGLKLQLQADFTKWFGSLDNITIRNVDATGLEKETAYDLLILDECHHSAASTYRQLNKKAWNNIYYRYNFTATPWRSQEEEQLLLESITGEVVYRLEYARAVSQGFIVPVEAYYYEIPKQEVDGYTWREVYSELVINHTQRNTAIAALLDRLVETGTSGLCLVKEVAHGEKIQSLMTHPTAFIKGENDDNRIKILEFNLRERLVLIGTEGVLGEGIDSKPAEYVIIAGLGKSKPRFMQSVGRAVRRYEGKDSAKIIIFKDNSHKWSLAHFKAQCKILKEEYGVIPIKLTI